MDTYTQMDRGMEKWGAGTKINRKELGVQTYKDDSGRIA